MKILTAFIFALVAFTGKCLAAEDTARFYATPEERREAGYQHNITPWLKISSLVELEKIYERITFPTNRLMYSSLDAAWQMGMDFSLGKHLSAEFLWEAKYENSYHAKLDETELGLDFDSWGMKIGKMYVPFGEFYSNFISGPILEFSETRANTFIMDYNPIDSLEISVYILESRFGNKKSDWGFSLEFQPDNLPFRAALGVLSDIAETEEDLLTDSTQHTAVPAYNINLLTHLSKSLSVSFEWVGLFKPFAQNDKNLDSPQGGNLELAYRINPRSLFAVRMEYSGELAESPRWRAGTAFSFLFFKRYSMSIEYLYGDYQSANYEDDNLGFADHYQSLATKLAVQL